jgi:hypothetical protein
MFFPFSVVRCSDQPSKDLVLTSEKFVKTVTKKKNQASLSKMYKYYRVKYTPPQTPKRKL